MYCSWLYLLFRVCCSLHMWQLHITVQLLSLSNWVSPFNWQNKWRVEFGMMRNNMRNTQTDIYMSFTLYFSPGDHLSSQQGPPPLPPAPPPHKQHPSITSLSRSSLANQRSPSPPPTAGLAADLQSTAECVQLQDSWVLGSNVALESRQVTHDDPPQLGNSSTCVIIKPDKMTWHKCTETSSYLFSLSSLKCLLGEKVLRTALLHPLEDNEEGAGFFFHPLMPISGTTPHQDESSCHKLCMAWCFFLLSTINKVNGSPSLRIMSSFLLSVCTHN